LRSLNFKKIVRRNNFTKVFGRIGKRKTIWVVMVKYLQERKKRTKMQMIRRASQGWRNQTYGRLSALKDRLRYGRYTPIRRFIK
jgi:hypothetical protein